MYQTPPPPPRTGHGSHSSLEAKLSNKELPALAMHAIISHEVRGEANPRKLRAFPSPGEEPAPRHHFLARLPCGVPVLPGHKDGAPRIGTLQTSPFPSSWKSEPCAFLEERRCLRLAACLSPGTKEAAQLI